ncbi:phenylalanine--tRNA ligase subunit beta [Legionella sp. CNM-4043-24]|uniref:phenylalanine--tRNA ligase subunit beta n=1 Tax=Legionella sp. CNM-4043-24 TaxID=3421646 RepID=UPI00403AF3BF
MKVSEIWLREWVNPAWDAKQLASRLTMAGLEVDSISPVAGDFDGVVVARVLSTSQHPQADKLSLCEVSTGTGSTLKIVCGASNVRAGLTVALAQIGARLPGGLVIKEARLRGELSQGMLCSASELGLAESSEGILELDEDAPLGTSFRDYMRLDDVVFDIELTPNRADCLSIRGVAREVAALTQTELQPLPAWNVAPGIDEQKRIDLQFKEACPLYSGRIIRDLNPRAVTPLWMRERLRRSGIRVIHPVVDVTNYVMLELGLPMHAMDLSRLQGDMIIRKSRKDESLALLDGQTITLEGTELVIADSVQPVALAGVMGGEFSAVNETSCDIFLESAWFNPISIAGVARRFGLSTDSAQRYERGVDPALPLLAIERATSLILEIAGGKAGPISMLSSPEHMPPARSVAFRPEKVRQLTGLEIPDSDMQLMLQGLGMTIKQGASQWDVQVPSHRMDIQLDVDLVEEVIRLYGYDNIKGDTMLAAVCAGAINPIESLAMSALNFFMARGYHETISYSFVDPELQSVLYPDAGTISLLNPISSELAQMRAGMWPGLIASMIYNMHRQQTAIKFIEQGVIFEAKEGGSVETPCLGGLLTGECAAMSWNETNRRFDFFDLKGDLQALFAALNLSHVRFEPAEHHALHPGKSAQLVLDQEPIGWCGVLHPRIADALDLQDDVVLFEIRLPGLTKSDTPRYQGISRFPQIRRDLSLLVDDSVSMAQIEQLVRETVDQNWLKQFNVFDVYTGESIPAGKKSVAIALTLQDKTRTLVDLEINQTISAIITKLEERFAITLRD